MTIAEGLSSALGDRYRLERELGQGGMATVYLAEDLRHDRKVAVKVLKPELAAALGAERFVQEIKTTAALSHPNILPLFDSGEAGGYLYYVMPYLEGETIRDKLNRETQFGIEEAVKITTEVAEALDYAHQNGVIHRDIKPENILLHAGRPMVMDFGIALAVSAAAGGRMTETGLSLGTPHYMSPEQATADKTITARSDIYSLASVLYEMLTGNPPHMGSSAQQIIMKIIAEPAQPPTELRKSIPPNVATALGKALEKLPADRFDSAKAFADALANPAFTAVGPFGSGAQAHTVSRSRLRDPVFVAVAAVAVVGTILSAWEFGRPVPETPPAPTFRMPVPDFTIGGPPGGGWRLAISRDGSTIVAGGDSALLYVRRSDDPEFRPIAGTAGALRPAISPDGEWVAFQESRGGIARIRIDGGPVFPVVASGSYPQWYADDEIIYYDSSAAYRVSPAGGRSTMIAANVGPRPFLLPGGRVLLHDGAEGLYMRVVGEDSSTLVGPDGSNGRYVAGGYILYGNMSLQGVMAVPFDLGAHRVTGPPVPVLPSVSIFRGGATQLAVSDNGTLLYSLSGSDESTDSVRLSWYDMAGKHIDLNVAFPARQMNSPRLSPDGSHVVSYDYRDGLVSVIDLNTGGQVPLKEREGPGAFALWAGDGKSVYTSSYQPDNLWRRQAADGSGDVQDVTISADGYQGVPSWLSPDGTLGVLVRFDAASQYDLWVARIAGDSATFTPYLRARWDEENATASPDGHWLAYVSNETGVHRVYVRSFPDPGPAAIPISDDREGARDPVWAPDGSAIYYRNEDDWLVRRKVRLGATVQPGERTRLFPVTGTESALQQGGRHGLRQWDIAPDGKRFLFKRQVGPVHTATDVAEARASALGPMVVVVNWFTELKRLAGKGE